MDCINSHPGSGQAGHRAASPLSPASTTPHSSMPIPTLPSTIQRVLITGAGGYVGAEVAKQLLVDYPTLELLLADLRAPSLGLGSRTGSVAVDLCDVLQVGKLFEGRGVDAVSWRERRLGRRCCS